MSRRYGFSCFRCYQTVLLLLLLLQSNRLHVQLQRVVIVIEWPNAPMILLLLTVLWMSSSRCYGTLDSFHGVMAWNNTSSFFTQCGRIINWSVCLVAINWCSFYSLLLSALSINSSVDVADTTLLFCGNDTILLVLLMTRFFSSLMQFFFSLYQVPSSSSCAICIPSAIRIALVVLWS